MLKLIGDTNGDGEFDEGIGDNHSGYNGIVCQKTNTLSHFGVTDLMVNDWQTQDPQTKKKGEVIVLLDKIIYKGDDVGSDWIFSVSVGGNYFHIPPGDGEQQLDHGEELQVTELIMRSTVADPGKKFSLDVKLNAIEVDTFGIDDVGTTSKVLEFKVIETNPGEVTLEVEVTEGDKTATISFVFSIITNILP